MKKRVLIAMSGGVDSSAAALLLQKQGYECAGATLSLCGNETDGAKRIADGLGMPFYIFDEHELFAREVMDHFVSEYRAGRTPNPCVFCNRRIKFGAMWDAARKLGADYLATGHYAKIRQDPATGRHLLCRGADRSKDQSYFLCRLTQEQLSRTLFPLGDLEKPAVRALAEAHGLINAQKRDSQDICFVPDGDYTAFLERYTGKTYPQGDFLDESGKVVGKHHGAVRYTIGQRKGLGLAMGAPVYVCGKDMQANTVTVGPNSSLFSSALQANDWNWFPFPELTEPMDVTVKIRHSQFEQPGRVFPEADGFARVEFAQPLRAVTPGQAVVLYQGDMVLGGGTITEAIR